MTKTGNGGEMATKGGTGRGLSKGVILRAGHLLRGTIITIRQYGKVPRPGEWGNLLPVSVRRMRRRLQGRQVRLFRNGGESYNDATESRERREFQARRAIQGPHGSRRRTHAPFSWSPLGPDANQLGGSVAGPPTCSNHPAARHQHGSHPGRHGSSESCHSGRSHRTDAGCFADASGRHGQRRSHLRGSGPASA